MYREKEPVLVMICCGNDTMNVPILHVDIYIYIYFLVTLLMYRYVQVVISELKMHLSAFARVLRNLLVANQGKCSRTSSDVGITMKRR